MSRNFEIVEMRLWAEILIVIMRLWAEALTVGIMLWAEALTVGIRLCPYPYANNQSFCP
jgi:hypothetical protein